MQDLKQLMVEAEQKMHATFDILDKKYNRKLKRPMRITWFVRGTRAGYADSYRNQLGLHQGLLRTNPQEMLSDTVPHEVCHLAAEELFGGQAKHVGPNPRSVAYTLK